MSVTTDKLKVQKGNPFYTDEKLYKFSKKFDNFQSKKQITYTRLF